MAIVRRGNQKVRSITGTGMSRVRRSVLRAYDQYLDTLLFAYSGFVKQGTLTFS